MKERTEYRKYKKYCINKDRNFKNNNFSDLEFYNYFSYPFPNHKFKLVHLPFYSKLVALDYGISDIIEYLNSKGYYTKYCCEGHKRKGYSEEGYIYFNELLEEDKFIRLKMIFSKLENTRVRFEDYVFRFYSKDHKKMLNNLYKLIKENIL